MCNSRAESEGDFSRVLHLYFSAQKIYFFLGRDAASHVQCLTKTRQKLTAGAKYQSVAFDTVGSYSPRSSKHFSSEAGKAMLWLSCVSLIADHQMYNKHWARKKRKSKSLSSAAGKIDEVMMMMIGQSYRSCFSRFPKKNTGQDIVAYAHTHMHTEWNVHTSDLQW